MKLIVLSSPVALIDEHHTINGLFELSLQYFHLRKPNASRESVVKLLKQIDPRYYSRIALHQFHEVAADFGIKRLHFKADLRNVFKLGLERYAEEQYLCSTSAHSIAELYTFEDFNYAFFSPVFSSLSKPGYLGIVPPDFALDVRIATEVIALGGITSENILQIKDMGFKGAAVLGTIWSDPANALKKVNDLIKVIANENYR